MNDTLIVEALGLLVAFVAVGAPIVRLNANIARLTATLEGMHDDITKHGDQIDSLNVTVANHGARIKVLEGDRRDTDV